MKCLGSVLVLLAFAVALLPAQVGDAPKQKPPAGKARKVYTNEDIAREPPPAPPAAASAAADVKTGESLAPFVPSPDAVIAEMLRVAEVTATDTVYDLGCGDGRILAMAAAKHGASAVGVELDPDLAKRALERAEKMNVKDKVKVIQGDMLQQDISGASVVTLYLLTSANEKLRPIMEKQLKPGTRVVSHDFEVPGWKAEVVHNFAEKVNGEARQHVIFLYRR